MAYQNGTAISPADLLQKLAVFLTANGWTQDLSVADGAGWRLHAHKGGVFINLRAAINEAQASLFDGVYTYPWSGIALYGGTGFTPGNTWKTQPGGPLGNGTASVVGAGSPMASGAISGYHFFADITGDTIVAVIEKTAGVFTHFGWGSSLEKLGTWTGGPYFFAALDGYWMSYNYASQDAGCQYSALCPGSARTNPNTFVRVDVDAFTGKWVGLGDETTGFRGYTGKRGSSCWVWSGTSAGAPSYARLNERCTNALNGQSLLLPIRFTVERDAGGYSFIGSLPHIFLTNACAKGFTPATVYPWGTDQYMVFPGPANGVHGGFAVKKV